MLATGLYPRNAAKSAEVGGISANTDASWGAPALLNDEAKLAGSCDERTLIMIPKNSAMLMVCPTFCSVASYLMQHLYTEGVLHSLLQLCLESRKDHYPSPLQIL